MRHTEPAPWGWWITALVLLICSSVFLASAGEANTLYFALLFGHVALGLAVPVALVVWWRRQRAKGGNGASLWFLAGLLGLLVAMVAGLLMGKVGNFGSGRWIYGLHIGASIAGVAALVVGAWRRKSSSGSSLPKLAAVSGLLLAILIPFLVQRYQAAHPNPKHAFSNSAAGANMAEEAMGGEAGPFFPSAVHIAGGERVPSKLYTETASCARGGCHSSVAEQWESSAHHLSSFNNQWYRKSIEYTQETVGVEASKWCGGCHDPALLQSGLMDQPIADIVHLPEAQAGLTCTACHLISEVRSSMGQGDYEVTVPPLHEMATSESPLMVKLHDWLVRADPEPHRRTFLKPFMRGQDSPEYCSTCHKVHLDEPVNNYRWVRGFNEYDNWQASGVSGYGARSFYYPETAQNCIDCHMPLVTSDDAGNDQGRVRSHRFAAANTALPTAYGDKEQLSAVVSFLRSRQVTVDIFAMTASRPSDEEATGLALDGPALATTFAVGEEGGMAVGVGGGYGVPTGLTEPVLAPLDRIPATVRRGESARVDVVVRTRGVGHFFPGGTVDAYDCWLELIAMDDKGKVIYWSGMANDDSPVSPDAHFYRSLMIDAKGNPIDKRNAFHSRAVVYVRLIPPGAADTARFRLEIPEDVSDVIRIEANLKYRKFSWSNTQWAYAGEPLAGEEATFSRDHDDRTFVFTGDTSDVSGPTKEIPRVPIVLMARDRKKIKVIDADAELPDMTQSAEKPEVDRERWNDYGIGLLLQGDLRAAKAAFERVTELEPGYVDGWVNLGRVAVAEGDLEAAREVLSHALELSPQLARAHFFLGLVDKEEGEYETALEHLRTAAEQYPRDRVVRNQIARLHFLSRDYQAAIDELQHVLAIDPENLMAHYTLMLSHRGLGDLETSGRHQVLYERFKADESSQVLTGEYREKHPHDNNERQPVHEHQSVPAAEIAAFLENPPGSTGAASAVEKEKATVSAGG